MSSLQRIHFAPVTVLVAGLVVTGWVGLLAQENSGTKDPALGTWRENVQKSTYSPGPPPRNGVLRRYALRPDGFTTVIQTGVGAQGNPLITLSAFKHDGREYPNYATADIGDLLATGTKTKATTSAKIVDPYTVTVTQRNAEGVVGIPFTRVVSKDGKTMTVTTKGTNAQGQPVNNVVVFDRVQ